MILWTKEHLVTFLPTFVAMIVIAVILKLTIGKKSEKIRMIPFQVVATILVVLEIIKQINELANGYDLYALPFHFCSLFIFFPFITAFYNGKFKDQIRSFTTIALAMLTLFMLIYPNLIYSANAINETFQNFSSFHTVVFHNLAVFEFVLVLALNLHTPNTKRDIKALLIGFGIFCIVSSVMAQVLATNFNNFYQCNIAPLETLRQSIQASAGYLVAQILYVLCVVVADFAFAFLSYGLYRLVLFVYGKIKLAFTKHKACNTQTPETQTNTQTEDSKQAE